MLRIILLSCNHGPSFTPYCMLDMPRHIFSAAFRCYFPALLYPLDILSLGRSIPLMVNIGLQAGFRRCRSSRKLCSYQIGSAQHHKNQNCDGDYFADLSRVPSFIFLIKVPSHETFE